MVSWELPRWGGGSKKNGPVVEVNSSEGVVGQSGGTGIRVPPARRSVGIFRCQPSAAITEPASVRININIGAAVSAGSGKHEGVMIGG